MLAATTFAALDWTVLVLYFALLVGTGVWLSKRQQGTEDYFLAGRRMPAWAVAISVLASALSVATFLGAPQQAYAGDLTYLIGNLGVIVAVVVVATVFIPAYYRHNVTTVYELLERRFGPRAKQAGSVTFMVGRVFASGARVYIAAHALAYAMFADARTIAGIQPWQLVAAIAILSAVGVLYTIAGGIETVIWTDVVQTCVFLVAIVAVVIVLLAKIPASTGDILAVLASPGDGAASKLRVVDTSLDPSRAWTIWTAITGVMLLNLAAYGTDHDLAQRMLTCKNALKGAQSVFMAVAASIPTTLLFMTVGLLLWVFYSRPDLMGASFTPLPDSGDVSGHVFLHFITTELPPGMSGLMIAGIFAVALGSLDSALNAMSATFVSDVYKPKRPGRPESHYLRVGRIGVVVWGAALGLFACVCVVWQRRGGQTFIDLALQVMTFAYSGLLAVFACALFTRRGSTRSVIAALVAGFMATLVLEPTLLRQVLVMAAPAGAPAEPGGWRDAVAWLAALAWPWRMTLATLIAFGVACMGRASVQRERTNSDRTGGAERPGA